MKRKLLFLCGWLALAIGAIGIFVPILPTTPLVLLASACFSASSERAYRYLRNNRVFGPYIEHYREGGGIARKEKIKALAFLWVALLIPILLIWKMWLTVLLLCVGSAVTVHLVTIKAKGKKAPTEPGTGTNPAD